MVGDHPQHDSAYHLLYTQVSGNWHENLKTNRKFFKELLTETKVSVYTRELELNFHYSCCSLSIRCT